MKEQTALERAIEIATAAQAAGKDIDGMTALILHNHGRLAEFGYEMGAEDEPFEVTDDNALTALLEG